MPNLGNVTKSLKSIFGLNSGLKSKLLELEKERNNNKRRRYVNKLIASKSNTTKVAPNKVSKKETDKSIFDVKDKDIIKDLLELKTTVKNNKIKAIKKDLLKSKNTTKNNKIKDKNSYVKALINLVLCIQIVIMLL